MNKKDRLWKAIVEEFFLELLIFHYPDFVKKIDPKKEFDFLDKELQNLFPEGKEIDRRADKVVRVWLKDGTAQWIVIHIEVQGYKDSNFARRMFTYYYRIEERFGVPIAALVIYSDKNQENRVNRYETSCLKTELSYKFDTYVIADYTVEEYEQMDNLFAIIYQTALMGLEKNLTDEELLEMKVQLFRKMYEKGYSKEQIRRVATFIKEYVRFSKREFNRKFDKRVEIITQNKKSMGIIETVLEIRLEEAAAEGMEKGQNLEAFLKEIETVVKLVNRLNVRRMAVADIAELGEINEEFVVEFQNKMKVENFEDFLKKISDCRDKFKNKTYNILSLKTDLALILLKKSFSEAVISKTLMFSPKKIKNNTT